MSNRFWEEKDLADFTEEEWEAICMNCGKCCLIKLQDEELSTGGFYRRDNLPELPKRLSIARKLIDAWLEGKV